MKIMKVKIAREDCSDLKEKRNESKSTCCRGYAPYNSYKCHNDLAGIVINRGKVIVERRSNSYIFLVVLCK